VHVIVGEPVREQVDRTLGLTAHLAGQRRVADPSEDLAAGVVDDRLMQADQRPRDDPRY
jgi:hypothetical protein